MCGVEFVTLKTSQRTAVCAIAEAEVNIRNNLLRRAGGGFIPSGRRCSGPLGILLWHLAVWREDRAPFTKYVNCYKLNLVLNLSYVFCCIRCSLLLLDLNTSVTFNILLMMSHQLKIVNFKAM